MLTAQGMFCYAIISLAEPPLVQFLQLEESSKLAKAARNSNSSAPVGVDVRDALI